MFQGLWLPGVSVFGLTQSVRVVAAVAAAVAAQSQKVHVGSEVSTSTVVELSKNQRGGQGLKSRAGEIRLGAAREPR